MRKHVAIFLFLILVLSLPSAAMALTGMEFEAKCQGFLQGTLPAAEFNAVCDEALALSRNAPPELRKETEYNVYRYKYMALVKMENYHEAYKIAALADTTYDDPVAACEMLITLNTKRDNIEAAQAAAKRGIDIYKSRGLKPVEFQQAYNELEKRKAKTLSFTADQFWAEVAATPAGTKGKYASAPIIISGTANFNQDASAKSYSLDFEVDDKGAKKTVSCQLPENELPFIKDIKFPAKIEAHGYFMSASDKLVLLSPSRFIRVLP